MEEIRQKGTTILMVTHDMGSIIKYCDRVVLLNKGEFIAEGPAGRVVDMYKKILAGQLEALKEELEQERQSGNSREARPVEKTVQGTEKGRQTVEMSDFSGGMGLDSRLMKDQLTINSDRTEYGDGRAGDRGSGAFGSEGQW